MPVEWMCPQCARLVSRSDRACDGCGANLRATRPTRVRGTRVTAGEWIRSPWTLFLGGTVFFLVSALLTRGQPGLGRAFFWAMAAWAILGMGAVYLAKLSEGLEEFFYYRPLCWWRDDPLDGWVLAIVIVGLECLALFCFVVVPSMPPGTAIWR